MATSTRSAPTAAEKKLASPRAPWRKRKRFLIEIMYAKDGEPRDIFVGGMAEGDMYITRGKPVVVPPSVITRLEDAVMGVPEVDPDDPDKVNVVERQRFSFSILRTIEASEPDPDVSKLVGSGRQRITVEHDEEQPA